MKNIAACSLMLAVLASPLQTHATQPGSGAPNNAGKDDAKASAPDEPTHYSAPDVLKRASFEKLPVLAKTGEGDGTKAYAAILAFYSENKKILDEIDDVPHDMAEKAIDLLIKAMEAGPPSKEFFDAQISMRPAAVPKFGSAMSVVVDVAMLRAEELHSREGAAHRERATKAAYAGWSLGRTMFEQSDRIPVKTQGILVLTASLTPLHNWSEAGTAEGKSISAWTDAINALVEKNWAKKSEVVYSLRLKTSDLRATIGDLMQIAQSDEDIAWRVEAILAMGRVKFMPNRGRGNDAAIRAAIEGYKKSDNKLIAEAAKAAGEYTKEDVKQMGDPKP